MTTREYERLLSLLLKLHEEVEDNGQLRDEISHVRDYIGDKVGW